MGRYRITRHIRATPEQVYRTFTDPVLVTDWMDSSGVLDPTGPLDSAGTRYTLVIWGPHRFRTQVITAEPPRLHETRGVGMFGASYRMVATLAARDGGTDLDLLTEYSLPFGAIGRLMDRRWVDREPRAMANREVDRLVTLASDPGVGLVRRGRPVNRDGHPVGDISPTATAPAGPRDRDSLD